MIAGKPLSAAFLLVVFSAGVAAAFTVKSYEGRFTIEFPGEPETRTVESTRSDLNPRHEWFLNRGGRSWRVSYDDYKPGLIADIGLPRAYHNAVIGSVNAVKGEIRSNDPIEHGTLSGREILVFLRAPNLVLRQRFFFEGDRFYQNIYIGPDGTAYDPDVEAFFSSFRVIR